MRARINTSKLMKYLITWRAIEIVFAMDGRRQAHWHLLEYHEGQNSVRQKQETVLAQPTIQLYNTSVCKGHIGGRVKSSALAGSS